MTPHVRRHRIVELLRKRPVASQEELAEALSTDAETVTQATISRDLRAIGAVKGPDGYMLPETPLTLTSATSINGATGLDRAIRLHMVDAALADSLVVLRTAPGHANAVAVEFDRHPPQGLVGTVAGDDTLFLACTSRTMARDLLKRLRRRRDLAA